VRTHESAGIRNERQRLLGLDLRLQGVLVEINRKWVSSDSLASLGARLYPERSFESRQGKIANRNAAKASMKAALTITVAEAESGLRIASVNRKHPNENRLSAATNPAPKKVHSKRAFKGKGILRRSCT
jgi:hypothetical protein